ncbi:MAG: AAA family ATPase [Proteobacteria bacterium]|nr:AAA family ATPase [Pseudomonadota bacterium]
MLNPEKTLLDFFLDPTSYSHKTQDIKHIETHISHVFIAGEYVYKIKKPVNFGFLDFTTLQRRRFYCHREVILNSRLSKDLYLGVLPIYYSNRGYSFKKSRGAKIVEYAIKMNRIDDKTILFNKIQNGCVLYNVVDKVAKHIAEFHKTIPPYKGKMSIYSNTVFSCEENFEQVKPYIGKTIDNQTYNKIKSYTRDFLKTKKGLFYNRKKTGFVKEIHGDLHSQHISLVAPPVIFDCIEFNNRFRIDDVLNDISFLLMDLEFNGRYDLSSIVRKVYEECYQEAINEDLIKFYKVYRAVVRGKVEGFISDTQSEDDKKQKIIKKARDYFSLAESYLKESNKFNPIIFFGLSGSGKSTIAKEFLESHIVIRSDEIRKKIAGQTPDKHVYVGFGQDIYSSDMTAKTYKAMIELMLEDIKRGRKVILDATFLKRWQRDLVIKACEEAGFEPFFINFFAPEGELFKRIEERRRRGEDISDAHEEILKRQIKEFEPPEELQSFRLLKINSTSKKEEIVKTLRGFL